MSPFGDRLRQARETKGLSLETIAESTRIARRHLSALERGDLEALPSGPFAKGYIRAYAEYLGVDPLPFLEAYRSEERRRGRDESEARDRVIEEMSHLVAQRSGATERSGPLLSGPKGIAIAGVAAGALGVAAWLFTRSPALPAAEDTPKPGAAETYSSPGSAAVPESGSPPALPHPQTGTVPKASSPRTPASPAVTHAPAAASAPPAAPTRSSPAASAEARAPSNLQVSDSGVGTDVSNNRLVGRADRFTPGTPVVFWTRVLGGRRGDAIRHVWFHEGQAVMRADLEIGGSHWRTYSRLDLPRRAIGSWAVEARRSDGQLLARQEFQCVREVR